MIMAETITFNGNAQQLSSLLNGHYLDEKHKITLQLLTLDCDAGESFTELVLYQKLTDVYVKGTNTETAVVLIEDLHGVPA